MLRDDERGAAAVVVAGLLVVGVVLGLLVTDVARIVAVRAQLATAADAAALAAAPATFADFGAGADPVLAAAETARANGSRLVECRCDIDHSWATRTAVVAVASDVELTILGSRHLELRAAAEFAPVRLGRD